MTTLGDRVYAERTARGWSRQQLADRVSKAAGVKCLPVAIEKLETRSSEKSKWSASLAVAFDVEHEWLSTGRGPKKVADSIDKRLKLLPPDISDRLYDQFDALITLEIENRQRRDQ